MNTEDTTITARKDPSMIFGMSVRALLSIMIVGTFCLTCTVRTVVPLIQLIQGTPTTVDIAQELNNLAIAVAAFYLGQKHTEKNEK